jgi:hypothetical protein
MHVHTPTHTRAHIYIHAVFCPQAFRSTLAFNQDLSAWSVARISYFANVFLDGGLLGCNQRRVYDAWGAAFRQYHPSFYPGGSCLSATASLPLNTVASYGAAVITILGTEFGTADASPSAYISGEPCVTTSWTSATHLVCSATTLTVAGGALHSVRVIRSAV